MKKQTGNIRIFAKLESSTIQLFWYLIRPEDSSDSMDKGLYFYGEQRLRSKRWEVLKTLLWLCVSVLAGIGLAKLS